MVNGSHVKRTFKSILTLSLLYKQTNYGLYSLYLTIMMNKTEYSVNYYCMKLKWVCACSYR